MCNIPLKLDEKLAMLCCKYPNLELLQRCCTKYLRVLDLNLDAVVADNRVDIILYLKSMLADGEHSKFYRNVVRKAAQAGKLDILMTIGSENCIDGFQDNTNIVLYNGHKSVVKFLLQCNQSRISTYQVYHVIRGGSLEMLKFCVEEMGHFEPQQYVLTAVESSSVDILDYLIHNGAVLHPEYIERFTIYAPLDASSQVLPISSHHIPLLSNQMLMLRYLYTHGHIYDLQTFICKYSHSDDVVKYFHSIGELKECKNSIILSALYREDFKMIDLIKV
tara:strand:+ start:24094 stop:24924 length:831 start_codon:yes stop_codon:yes gene_type:complete